MTRSHPPAIRVVDRDNQFPRDVLDALESIYGICFSNDGSDQGSPCDGVLVVNQETPSGPLPGVPELHLHGQAGTSDTTVQVRFTSIPEVDRVFRSRALGQSGVCLAAFEIAPTDAHVLAVVGRSPLWWRETRANGASVDVSLAGCPAPLNGAPLRARFRPGEFLGLLPLLDLIRRVRSARRWIEPSLRASILIDDPNLHATSYGYVDFRALVAAAREESAHVALAAIPLDLRWSHPTAVRLIRDNPAEISLLMHGNNHTRRELARSAGASAERQTIAQALARVERFERRQGVPVARLMAPPHGDCSRTMMVAMFESGIDALCVSRPFPWRAGGPPQTRPDAGWGMADYPCGPLPVIPRYRLSDPREDLIFRAFLRQPLILYGHHTDFRAGGAEVVASAAADVRALGDVTWSNLAEVAETNYAIRRSDGTAEVDARARTVRLTDGLSAEISFPLGQGEISPDLIGVDVQNGELTGVEISANSPKLMARVQPDGGDCLVRLTYLRPLAQRTTWVPRPVALLRRAATESRDRVSPKLARWKGRRPLA